MDNLFCKRINTVIFDLDGTLLDTLQDLAFSTNYALRTYKMPEHSITEIRHFVGNGVHKLIERAVPIGINLDIQESVFDTFRKHYLEHSLDNTTPYPGILSLLENLKRLGYKIAVVSNKLQPAVSSLTIHFFSSLIDVAIGESEDIPRKPSPAMVYEAIRQLEVTKEECIYVGDSDVDILTASNVGVPCVSVLWGFRNREFLEQHGASLFIENPGQLLSLLPDLQHG